MPRSIPCRGSEGNVYGGVTLYHRFPFSRWISVHLPHGVTANLVSAVCYWYSVTLKNDREKRVTSRIKN